jgi:hypothetical protein
MKLMLILAKDDNSTPPIATSERNNRQVLFEVADGDEDDR